MEKDWVSGIKKGDMKGFQEIVKSYQKRVFSFAYSWLRNRADAEDAVQEVFWRVLKHIKRYDENRAFSTWVFAVAMNVIKAIYKKNKRKPKNMDEAFLESVHVSDDGFDSVEDKIALYQILDRLGEDDRNLFYLRYAVQMKISEIAELRQETEANVKTRLFRLREKMGRQDPEETYVERTAESIA